MNERNLDSLLCALGDAGRRTGAPARVEDSLRAAFRARHKRRWPMLAVAAIVLLLVGTAVAWMGRSRRQPISAALPPTAPAPRALAPESGRPPLPVAAKRAARRPRPRRVQPPAPPVRPAEVATEFLPLDETVALAPIESAQVVRVQLPRAALVRFGFPVSPDRLSEPLQADVVFAQDGIARAVRFVK